MKKWTEKQGWKSLGVEESARSCEHQSNNEGGLFRSSCELIYY